MLFFTHIALRLMRNAHLDEGTASLATTDLAIGIGAGALMSVGAVILLYRSFGYVKKATDSVESFLQGAHIAQSQPLKTADEAERLSLMVTNMISELKTRIDQTDHYATELSSANKKLAQFALKDGLTGLFNQTYIKDRLANELIRAKQYGRAVSVLMIDIDNFKGFNDTRGHVEGDAALQEVSRLICGDIRPLDIPSRYGGEEFLVILPETAAQEAAALAEKIRGSIEMRGVALGLRSASSPLTVSIGVSGYSAERATPEAVISAADDCLYGAKRNGKNRVVV
jgi:diguanylate cyclase (GGDEF)-like protein